MVQLPIHALKIVEIVDSKYNFIELLLKSSSYAVSNTIFILTKLMINNIIIIGNVCSVLVGW